MSQRSFIAELQRRNVHRAAMFYAGAAWLLVQVATQVFPFFDIPGSTVRIVIVAAVVGFPFVLVFSWFYEWTPDGYKLDSEVPRELSESREGSKKLDRAIIVVLSVAVVLLLSSNLVSRNGKTATAEQSIAVLPLANSTGDPAQEYFSDGISEELISSLSRLDNLKVISRTSSFKFKGRTEDTKTIGEALSVAYLLEGSVRKSNNRVRIAVALVKAVDGANIWSESFDRDLQDIFAVQSEIASAVARQLNVALLGGNPEALKLPAASQPADQNVAAYNALLQGNFYGNRRTVEDFQKAVEQYRTAIKLEPGYALAWARLSIVLSRLLVSGAVEDGQRSAMGLEVRTAADTAQRLDPMLSEASQALGMYHFNVDLNQAAAQEAFRRAAVLAPNDAAVISSLGVMKAEFGQLEEAVQLNMRAIELDPLRIGSYQNLANNYIALGLYDEAEAALQKSLLLQPQVQFAYSRLAIVQILRGKPAEALTLAQKEPEGFIRDYALALALYAVGDRVAADAALKKFIAEHAEDSASQIASIYALRRDQDQVFRWLEHAIATKDAGITEMRIDPFLPIYKDDLRYLTIAQKVGVMTEDEVAKARSGKP